MNFMTTKYDNVDLTFHHQSFVYVFCHFAAVNQTRNYGSSKSKYSCHCLGVCVCVLYNKRETCEKLTENRIIKLYYNNYPYSPKYLRAQFCLM